MQEQQKKEFKLANANVGDRPQIDSGDESDDDLLGDRLNTEGKKLKRMMRKRGDRDDDIFGSDEDVSIDTTSSDEAWY
jgi:transcription initiation factor TFIIF subunit alpha